MKTKLRNQKGSTLSLSKGFTIIEVLIVLAIAGLILLIVFLAVPALQRNSRNTQRKNDASSIASAISNFLSNNNGSLPVGLGKNTNTNILEVCSAGGANVGGTTVCTANTNLESGKVGYFKDSSVNFRTWVAGDTVTTAAVGSEANAAASKVSTEYVLVVSGATCADPVAGIITPVKSPRSASIYYALESGGTGNGSLQCIEQ